MGRLSSPRALYPSSHIPAASLSGARRLRRRGLVIAPAKPLRSDVAKALEDNIRSKHPDVAGHGDLSKLPYGKLPALLVEAAARCGVQLGMTSKSTKSLAQRSNSFKTLAQSPDTSAASTSQLEKTPIPLKLVTVKKDDRKEDNDIRPAYAVFNTALLDEPARKLAESLNTTPTHLFLATPELLVPAAPEQDEL